MLAGVLPLIPCGIVEEEVAKRPFSPSFLVNTSCI